MKINRKLIFLVILIASLAMGQSGKWGPRLYHMVQHPENTHITQESLLKKTANDYLTELIVTHSGHVNDLRRSGAWIIASRGDIAVVSIPLSKIEALSNLPSVIYIQKPAIAKVKLNKSAEIIQAVKARTQRGVTGENVIVGIIDSGIDIFHHDFRNADGSTRIRYLLDLSEPGTVYRGTVYTEDQINESLDGFGVVNQVDISGHGTHVAGIAAGDGSIGVGYGEYSGIAPMADLVVVKATRDAEGQNFITSDKLLALTFVDSIASMLGKPYVVNLSLGSHYGAHDGTSPAERFIDNLVGPGIPGKVIVTVAGNEGDVDIHGRATINSNRKATITFDVQSYVPNLGGNNDIVEFGGWYDGDQKIGVTLITPSGRSYGPVLPGTVYERETNEGLIYIWNGFYEQNNEYQPGVNPFNGDREFYIQITDQDAMRPAKGEWTLEFSGSGGTIDVWLTNNSMEVSVKEGLVDDGKLSIPGTARHAITVGAFVSKKEWTDVDGNRLTFKTAEQVTVGDLAAFSSPGPVRKYDFQKPEITAPGQIVASSYSKDAPASSPLSVFYSGDVSYPNAFVVQGGEHALSSGTSMAAPHVTGAVALILQQNPEFTAIQIREMIEKSAAVDNFVDTIPNTYWGWGKLDVYKALQIDPDDETPTEFMFYPPAPNPFINQTQIVYELPLVEDFRKIKIDIYNAIGQRVRTLVNEVKNSGVHAVYWDGRNESARPVASGIYLIHLTFGNSEQTKKVVYLGTHQ